MLKLQTKWIDSFAKFQGENEGTDSGIMVGAGTLFNLISSLANVPKGLE